MGYQHGASNIWFNFPGIVAAYQPWLAPDFMAARQNIAAGKLGTYTATPGAAPPWSSQGWAFSDHSLLLGIVPTLRVTSALARYKNLVTSSQGPLVTTDASPGYEFTMIPWYSATSQGYWANGNYTGGAGLIQNGVMGVSGLLFYQNGKNVNSTSDSGTTTTNPLRIGKRSAGEPLIATIQAVAIYSRSLTLWEMWQASWQMFYCDQNPDWNVWAPRRRYWMAAGSGAAFQAAWARRHNTLLGGGVN